nr:uncharacterized protein LOC109157655 [Ipomoea batatas]
MNPALILTFLPPKLPSSITAPSLQRSTSLLTYTKPIAWSLRPSRRLDFRAWTDDGDADGGDPDDYDMDEEEAEEADNKKDFDVDYDTSLGLSISAAGAGGDDDIAMVYSSSFVSTQGWDSEKIVDYRINEDEFHKISLHDCDFFIRRPPDPDNDMYVTPPDTDVYAIPKVLAPMPQKVYLTKHYRNRRLGDPDFVLDFEEIYVIDSKTKSITRAKVVVTVPEGINRDRKNDLLVIHDNGNSFKIIPSEEREDPSLVIQKEEWKNTREDMEKHLRKLRDFSISNWF